jgi:hypothetical protein
MSKDHKDKIAKLPKWAQEYIVDIERQRNVAINALNKWTDSQTEFPFFIDELVCTGEKRGPSFKKRYVQAHNITAVWGGVRVDVRLREYGIDIDWGDSDGNNIDVAFIPYSYQHARILTKENMRR